MLEALRNTPNWVYFVFFLVLYYGVIQCFASQSKPHKLVTLPAIFLGWSAYATATLDQVSWLFALMWLAGLAVASPIGWALGRRTGAKYYALEERLFIPGSTAPLLISLLFFGISYWFGYTRAVNPELADDRVFLLAKTFASASCISLLVGRAAYLFSLARSHANGCGPTTRAG